MKTWLSALSELYNHDPEAVMEWLLAKNPQLFLDVGTNLNIKIPLSPIEAICYSQEDDVATVVHQLVSGAYS